MARQSDQVFLPVEADALDRIEGGIVAKQHRPFRLLWQDQDIEAFAHIEAGQVHVDVPTELERDLTDVGS